MNCSEMRSQRDLAVACFVLAFCVSLAVFLSVFGRSTSNAIDDAKKAVAIHERMLGESAKALKQNQDALGEARAALDRLVRAHGR